MKRCTKTGKNDGNFEDQWRRIKAEKTLQGGKGNHKGCDWEEKTWTPINVEARIGGAGQWKKRRNKKKMVEDAPDVHNNDDSAWW